MYLKILFVKKNYDHRITRMTLTFSEKQKKCLDIYYFAYWNTSIYVSHQNLLEFLLFQFDLENLLSDSPTGVMERNSVKVFYIFVLHVYLCSYHDYIAGFFLSN